MRGGWIGAEMRWSGVVEGFEDLKLCIDEVKQSRRHGKRGEQLGVLKKSLLSIPDYWYTKEKSIPQKEQMKEEAKHVKR